MKLLTRRKPHHQEAVEIKEKRFGYFPKAFRWRGKHYSVQAVERCWSHDFADKAKTLPDHYPQRRKRANVVRSAPHLCFRVRCREGTFDLFQNVRDNTWHLVPLRA